MKLIVGLGNPGKKYAKTRHNVGFMVVDRLREVLTNYGMNNWELSKKFNARISGCTYDGEKILLIKPMTFMNDSGQSVQLIAHYYKIPARDVVVVHDDKDIPLGEVRVQEDRGHAGHNGIKSIMQHLGSKEFSRIRIGIASKDDRKMGNTAKFVLGKFGMFEKKKLQASIQTAVEHLMKDIQGLH